jgi:peptide/nickel transport system substrate-binding protein
MTMSKHTLDHLRNSSNAIWNAAVDEHAAGRIDRRTLFRYAGLIGLTGLAAAHGLRPSAARAAAASGGTVRVGLDQPTGTINPIHIPDPPSISVVSQVGEYLAFDDSATGLHPQLATSWSADASGQVWTFKLRQGVRFHNGQPLTAKDVVATFERLVDPNSGSGALSALKGVLSKGGTKQVDDETVAFTLDAPNGNFPYYVSSDVYNAVILPADYAGDFEKNFNGTGPFKLESYRPKQGVSFVRNPDYWGTKALPDRVEITFFDDPQAQLLALQSRQVDVIPFTNRIGLAVQGDPDITVLSVQASNHNALHLRVDEGPFKDKRVRRALALSLDRPGIIKGLLRGRGQLGNDSPFAPVFASTDRSVPQRTQDLEQARRLLAEAGVANGFAVTLTTERAYEIPDYAVLVQNAAKKIGIEVTLNVEPQDVYYGDAVFGKSHWLDTDFGVTDYGHRGTPDIFLKATLTSDGSWNASHFRSPAYDRLLAEYTAALDLATQRTKAKAIQELLLDETPVVIAYFSAYSRVTSARIAGVRFTAISHLLLDQAHFVSA